MSLFGKKKNKESDFEDFPPIGGLMVSNMVAVDKMKPLFMYREKSTRPEDSGWRIFSGHESDEYANNAGNIGIYDPITILKIDPSIADLLLKGVGSVFERDPKAMTWHAVADFEMEDDYMVDEPVGERWTIRINNLFERREEESGDLFFTTGDKSVRIAVWNMDETKAQLYEEHQDIVKNRDETDSRTLETFEFSDPDVSRIGYRIRESDERRSYDVIYGFSIVDHQLVQVALYYDDEKDKGWAIETWRSIRIE